MLTLQNISKDYKTGDEIVHALKSVNLQFAESEFVSILGPSGCGKTTLLNIIGGLDHATDGELMIDNQPTKLYKARDWDSYRNHSIGFVFQSYNLIGHQSVLRNVELALTLSGVSKKERRQRAIQVLTEVGLSDQIKKRPNQLSGGQLQRVAIARALVNEPQIILADEPTGALDTDTSVQIMELLKEVSKTHLVIMVTHNSELAENYSTRIIHLKDGAVLSDSKASEATTREPLTDEVPETAGKCRKVRTSMHFLTALSLSLNNLMTKKGRTLITAFAGSIGIIGIALILSLSNGASNYIDYLQKDTMQSYPITIEAETYDVTEMFLEGEEVNVSDTEHGRDAIYSSADDLNEAVSYDDHMLVNNLSKFKTYLDDPDCEVRKYLGESGILYDYPLYFTLFSYDPDGILVDTNGSVFRDLFPSLDNASDTFFYAYTDELLPGKDDLVSASTKKSYDILAGSWPASYNEIILVLDENNELSLLALYGLGLLPAMDYVSLLEDMSNEEILELSTEEVKYSEILGKTFYVMPMSSYYNKNAEGLYVDNDFSISSVSGHLDSAVPVTVSGIVRPNESEERTSIYGALGYTHALTEYLIDFNNTSEVVKAQLADPTVSVLTGLDFEVTTEEEKVEMASIFLTNMDISERAKFAKTVVNDRFGVGSEMSQQLFEMSEMELSELLDEFLAVPDDSLLILLYDSYITKETYEQVLSKIGYTDRSAPDQIEIFTDSFSDKDAVSKCIEHYNQSATVEDQIQYVDYIAIMLSDMTQIIDGISYILIAFVAISLVVSSIMIGIITYISVLERTKEIGILRSIGASKRDISRVFNAETFLVGLFAGLLGVGITILLCIPANTLIHRLTSIDEINASLPAGSGFLLILISIALTLIAGLFPSRIAAKKDPVTALRSE